MEVNECVCVCVFAVATITTYPSKVFFSGLGCVVVIVIVEMVVETLVEANGMHDCGII